MPKRDMQARVSSQNDYIRSLAAEANMNVLWQIKDDEWQAIGLIIKGAMPSDLHDILPPDEKPLP